MVKFPRLMDGYTKYSDKMLDCMSLAIDVTLEPASTATMVMHTGQNLTDTDWVELFSVHGSEGKFRVVWIDTNIHGTQTVELEHGIATLKNSVCKGDGKLTGTLAGILEQILEKQEEKHWILGSADESQEESVQYSDNDLLELTKSALSLFEGYRLTYEMDVYPWRVNVVKMADEDECEGRFSRNMSGVNIYVDKSNLCTRAYTDIAEGYTDADTIEKYGVVSQILTIPDQATEEQVSEYVNRYLERYKDPVVSIKVRALDLCRITGETFDALTCGKKMRCIVPEENVVISNRIVRVSYVDVLADGENAVLTLNRQLPTLRDIIVEQQKQTRRGGGAGSKIKKLENRFSEYVYNADIRMSEAEGWIDLYAEKLNVLTQEHLALEIRFDTQEEELLLRATKSELNELGTRVTTAESRITLQSDQIEAKVSKGEVISSINLSAEQAKITSARIDLVGYVTASKLQSSIADLQYTNSLAIETNFLSATNTNFTYLTASSFTFANELISKRNVTMGEVTSANKVLSNGVIDLSHSHKVSVAEDGTVTLGEVSETGGNFNVADTKAYKEAVSAAAGNVTISASGWQPTGTNTVTASNGKQLTISIPNVSVGSSSWVNGSKTVNAYYGNIGPLGSTTISLPTNNNVTYTWTNPSQGYARVEFTIGGRTYSSSRNVSGYV